MTNSRKLNDIIDRENTNPMMHLQKLVILFITFLFIHIYAQENDSNLPTEELTAIASQIENYEKNLINIEVVSEAFIEERLSKSDPWQKTPIYVSSTAILNGLPNSKARIDVHEEVLEWKEGNSPYAATSYSLGFDGQCGKTIRRYLQTSKGKYVRNECEITPQAPELLQSSSLRAFTGQQFSMQFCLNSKGYTFSQLFRWATDPNTKADSSFIFSRATFYGIECIKISTRKDAGESWWLDPNRGYALLGYKFTGYYENGDNKTIAFARVINLEEVASGIWWPKEVVVEADPDKPGEPHKRMVYRASSITANNPKLDNSVFTIELPDGCLVDDKVKGLKYKINAK